MQEQCSVDRSTKTKIRVFLKERQLDRRTPAGHIKVATHSHQHTRYCKANCCFLNLPFSRCFGVLSEIYSTFRGSANFPVVLFSSVSVSTDGCHHSWFCNTASSRSTETSSLEPTNYTLASPRRINIGPMFITRNRKTVGRTKHCAARKK